MAARQNAPKMLATTMTATAEASMLQAEDGSTLYGGILPIRMLVGWLPVLGFCTAQDPWPVGQVRALVAVRRAGNVWKHESLWRAKLLKENAQAESCRHESSAVLTQHYRVQGTRWRVPAAQSQHSSH